MSRRVPYISGGTKTRDHFQFRRLSPDEFFSPGGLPGADYLPVGGGSLNATTIELPLETSLKWLWRVREWQLEVSISGHALFGINDFSNCDPRPNPSPPPDFNDPPEGGWRTSGTVGARLDLTGTLSATIKSYAKTGPIGIQGYSGAVANQPETAIETDLLDSFRDKDKFAIFTRGYFGFAPDRVAFPHIGTGPGYPPFGFPENTFDPSGGTIVGSGLGLTPADVSVAEVSRTGFFTMALARWDPPVPPDNTEPISNDQLIWNPGTKKVKMAYAFGFDLGFTFRWVLTDSDGYVYGEYTGPSPGFCGARTPIDRFIELSCAGDAGNGHGTMTVDGITFPLFVGQPSVGSMDATVTLTPTKFWAYKNRLGQPVYDESSGVQINDPFA